MNKKIIIIGIIIVLLAAVGIGAYFIFFKGEPEEKPEELFSYTPGEYFVTNVKNSKQLFKVTIILMVNDEKLPEKLKENEYIIRDTIIFKLRALTADDINASDIRERLGKEIIDNVNAKLSIDNIKAVYFNDFVMQ